MIFLPANDVATYSVGDFVYTKPEDGRAPVLARIESAHSLRSNQGPIWLVRRRMRGGWSSAYLHCPIDRALSAAEVTHCRKLGLIPKAGDAL